MKFDSGDAGTAESGTIVTFYSFKGGTGRTMSLANVAWILASNGKRVLVMDWDLEAPGLHRYFTPFLGDPDLASTEGLIDLVRKFELRVPRTTDEDLREYARVERYATTLTTTFPDGGYIDFVSSGKQTEEYSETINTYDWRGFYERRDGAAFLHALREDMRRNYDYVLIDSRTGFGDTSGITTMMLPDVLVNCFTLNTQSVDGGADIARDVKRGAPHVKIIPVPMRVDYAEQEKLEASRDHARRRFQEFLKDTPRAADPDSYWGAVEIPTARTSRTRRSSPPSPTRPGNRPLSSPPTSASRPPSPTAPSPPCRPPTSRRAGRCLPGSSGCGCRAGASCPGFDWTSPYVTVPGRSGSPLRCRRPASR